MRILGLFLILIVLTQDFWTAALLSIGAYFLFRPDKNKKQVDGGKNNV